MRSIALALLLLSMSSIALCSSEQQICLYQTEQGIVQVNSLNDVPEKYRASAQCIDVTKATGLAKPEDISLTGLVRHEQMSTSVGRIDLRWPR
ncbi:MAG: hypothetical protein KDD53_06545, partial [Bdellovibrionales bacterium]|nr:hypothetical protein [Bdellovibrionales bacterium]